MGQKIDYAAVALIVEDDPDVRSFAVALLQETDLDVVEVASGEEALRYLDHNAGEVAFLFAEVKLSHPLSGLDVARMARLKWPWIRTVLTSREPLDDDLDKALSRVRFIPKPWTALEVLMEAERATL